MIIRKEFSNLVLQSKQASPFNSLKEIHCNVGLISYSNWSCNSGYDRGVYTHRISEGLFLNIKRK